MQVWDYNDIWAHELIGETSIDLDDRFFNPEWQKLKYKPIEYRQLFHPDSNIS